MKAVLSVAGSDPSGGAGIQADLKTMTLNGVYAMAVPTALTAQNTLGVFDVFQVPSEFFRRQLECVLSDILPAAVKIGMMYSKELILITAELLREYKIRNIVVDPVMISTSGKRLLEKEAEKALQDELFPLATLITPNLPEAETLSGVTIRSTEEREKAAKRLFEKFGCAVLIKGGHGEGGADDLLYCKSGSQWLKGERIKNPNTHGTGCTLSSAIASNLAKGFTLLGSVTLAKEFVAGAIAFGLDLGKGRGPMNHAFDIDSRFLKAAENNHQGR